MTHRILHALLAIAVLFFAVCSKNNDLSNNDNNTGIGPPPSKVTVKTYAGKTIVNSINGPGSLCLDENGYIAETGHKVVIKVDPLLQTVDHFAGDFNDPGCVDDPFGSGTPSLTFPENLWIGKDMQIYIGDDGCGKAKIANTTGELNGLVTAIAGNGEEGYVDGPGDKAEFGSPRGISFTTSGDNNILYVRITRTM